MTQPKTFSRRTNLFIWLLLVLASLHCTRCIFYDNVSYVHLDRYAAGTEDNPFQSRVAMVPVLRAANHSRVLTRIANYLEPREREQLGRKVPGSAENESAMKVACIFIGLACILGMVFVLGEYGIRYYGYLWWLAPAIALVMLFTSFAARSEQAYWYPYDLPHMLIFGAACLCILTGRIWWLLAFFVIDIPVRETSIYLIPLSLSMVPWRLKPRQAAYLILAMSVLWLGIHLPIAHHFAHNRSEVGSRLPRNLENIFSPLHIGQIGSALGFLLLPIFLGRRHLAQRARNFLYLSIPCLLVTAYFGIWIETRITIEWTLPFALIAATECVQVWKSMSIAEIQPAFAPRPQDHRTVAPERAKVA